MWTDWWEKKEVINSNFLVAAKRGKFEEVKKHLDVLAMQGMIADINYPDPD